MDRPPNATQFNVCRSRRCIVLGEETFATQSRARSGKAYSKVREIYALKRVRHRSFFSPHSKWGQHLIIHGEERGPMNRGSLRSKDRQVSYNTDSLSHALRVQRVAHTQRPKHCAFLQKPTCNPRHFLKKQPRGGKGLLSKRVLEYIPLYPFAVFPETSRRARLVERRGGVVRTGFGRAQRTGSAYQRHWGDSNRRSQNKTPHSVPITLRDSEPRHSGTL